MAQTQPSPQSGYMPSGSSTKNLRASLGRQNLGKLPVLEEPKRFFCSIENCNSNFGRSPDLTRHQKTVHGPKKQCIHTDCMFETARPDKMKEHLKKLHPESEVTDKRDISNDSGLVPEATDHVIMMQSHSPPVAQPTEDRTYTTENQTKPSASTWSPLDMPYQGVTMGEYQYQWDTLDTAGLWGGDNNVPQASNSMAMNPDPSNYYGGENGYEYGLDDLAAEDKGFGMIW